MRGYLIPKGTPGWLVINNGEPNPFTTTKEQMFFEEHLKVDPLAYFNGKEEEVPAKYRKFKEAALKFIHGFEMPGNKELDTRYLLLIEGKDIIVG
jgi:hypothetical protein